VKLVTLAIVGIYGLLSYWVGIRAREIAIRLALGAHPRTIMRWTSTHALRLATIGITLGALGSWLAAKSLQDLVFGVDAKAPQSSPWPRLSSC
jgi:putative ABC transport system permease protein